jgi:hypothetical protein
MKWISPNGAPTLWHLDGVLRLVPDADGHSPRHLLDGRHHRCGVRQRGSEQSHSGQVVGRVVIGVSRTCRGGR